MEHFSLTSTNQGAVFTACSALFGSDLQSLSCFVFDDDGLALFGGDLFQWFMDQ